MNRHLKMALRYVKGHILFYVLGILSLLVVDVVNTFIPRLTGALTDGLAYGVTREGSTLAMTMADVWPLALKILLCGAFITLGRFGWRYFIFGAARSIEKEMRNDLFGHLERLSMRYYHAHKTGDLMAHFTNDLQSVRQLLGMTVISTFDASVMLVLVIYSMLRYVNPRLTLIAILPMVLIIFGDILFGKAMHKRFLLRQEAFSDLTDMVQESVSGIRVIKAYVQEHLELAAFAKQNENTREKNLGVVRLVAMAMPLLDLVIGISMLITLVYGGYLTIHGEMTLGQFVAFNSYLSMLVWPMMAVGECISSLSQGLASLQRVQAIMDEKPEIEDRKDVRKDITALQGGFALDHLTFAYPDGDGSPVLEDVSVSIRPGETLAIVGRTGCGKSTIVSLLERLYDTERAHMVTVDGVPVSKVPLSVLHRDIAYVPQDSFLFSASIAENIAFGVDNVDRAQIEDAARCACIHESIMEFPEGYETVVGERGVTLSGGQKQRVSIARALIRNAPILILDDALSAVDTDTEEQILRHLKTLREGQTNILIAHRISTIQHADHILVLEDGKAVEYGSHASLMEKGGVYRAMYERQQLEKQLHAMHEGGEEA
ncbi:MAG: ABC transporter ATP-binding protein [Clostridia bacterium]|nr:ABC transporter ATP-binding protein [Clostridia bacterium]